MPAPRTGTSLIEARDVCRDSRQMHIALCIAAGAVGAAFGWFVPPVQHRLYSRPEYRENPASGRTLLALRIFLTVSCAAASALALRPHHYAFGPAVLTALFALALLVTASTDFERRIIPNLVSYPGIVAALALSWAWPDRSVTDIALGGAFAIGVAVALFALGIAVGALLGGGAALGMGDAKLMVWIGVLAGWPAVTNALVYGVLAAGVISIALLVRGGARKRFSYGPYLVLGALVVILFPGRFV